MQLGPWLQLSVWIPVKDLVTVFILRKDENFWILKIIKFAKINTDRQQNFRLSSVLGLIEWENVDSKLKIVK